LTKWNVYSTIGKRIFRAFDGQLSQFLAVSRLPMSDDTKASAKVGDYGCESHFVFTIGVEYVNALCTQMIDR
jgi:hypothetical protein